MIPRLRAATQVTSAGRLRIHDEWLPVLTDVVVDFDRCAGRRGGEPLDDVRGQSEADETYRFRPGFLALPGAPVPERVSLRRPELARLLSTLRATRATARPAEAGRSTLLVLRDGYANLFHTMTDLYNAFVASVLAGAPPSGLEVVLADGHPASPLDALWTTVFGAAVRIGSLRGRRAYRRLLLVPPGFDSPLEHVEAPTLPLAGEFRRLVLRAFGISTRPHRGRRVRVTLVRREDYRAHPRNPRGTIQRKLANERSLLGALRRAEIGAPVEVRAVALELESVREQLRIVAETDLLVGMHGAGLTHALFLPDHAGLVELYPAYYSPATRYFRRIAEWRGLHYQGWQNTDPRRERRGHRTIVPPAVVVEALRRFVRARRGLG